MLVILLLPQDIYLKIFQISNLPARSVNSVKYKIVLIKWLTFLCSPYMFAFSNMVQNSKETKIKLAARQSTWVVMVPIIKIRYL